MSTDDIGGPVFGFVPEPRPDMTPDGAPAEAATSCPEMVQRVARAIEDAMASDDCSPEDLARAALAAMRYPSAALEAAAVHKTRSYHDQTDEWWRRKMPKDLYRLAFTAMIDAALA